MAGTKRVNLFTFDADTSTTPGIDDDRGLGPDLRRPAGGYGATGENWLVPGGVESRAEPLRDKCTVALRAGGVLRMLTPGGALGSAVS